MGDITSKRLLVLKGALFVALGLVAVALILLRYPDWRLGLLLGVAIWAFCRAYYFAFYVVHHHIDPEYRFAGLGSVIAYLWRGVVSLQRRSASATSLEGRWRRWGICRRVGPRAAPHYWPLISRRGGEGRAIVKFGLTGQEVGIDDSRAFDRESYP